MGTFCFCLVKYRSNFSSNFGLYALNLSYMYRTFSRISNTLFMRFYLFAILCKGLNLEAIQSYYSNFDIKIFVVQIGFPLCSTTYSESKKICPAIFIGKHICYFKVCNCIKTVVPKSYVHVRHSRCLAASRFCGDQQIISKVS